MDLLSLRQVPPDHCSANNASYALLVSQLRRNSSGIVDFWVDFIRFLSLYMTTPELEAIRGQSSAASLPTGPVMADPFISPLALTIWREKLVFGARERGLGSWVVQHASKPIVPNDCNWP